MVLMASTQKTSITLTVPQHEYLTAEAARLGITIADLVRRIIDQHREAPDERRRHNP